MTSRSSQDYYCSGLSEVLQLPPSALSSLYRISYNLNAESGHESDGRSQMKWREHEIAAGSGISAALIAKLFDVNTGWSGMCARGSTGAGLAVKNSN